MTDYTTNEAADRLGVTRAAVLMAIKRGRLLSWKRGCQRFIDKSELDRWNKERKK